MLSVLGDRLKSRTRALELMLVREGLKPCARLAIGEEAVDGFETLLSELKLVGMRSDFRIELEFRGLYSTKGTVLPKDSPGGHSFYYVSRDEAYAKLAKEAEAQQDIAGLGEALGYPKCCIKFFIENREMQIRSENDYIIPAIRSSEGRSFQFHMNVLARYFDFALISHAPHSLECPASMKLAQRNMNWLFEHDHKLALTYQRFMSGVGFYLDNGIAWLPRAEVEHGKVLYDRVFSSPSGHPIGRLLDGRPAHIDKKNLLLGETELSFREWGQFS